MALPDAYAIRLFQDGDARALATITLAAIKRLGLTRYSQPQVQAWAARHPSPDRFVERAHSGALILVVTAGHGGMPVAYCLLERDETSDGHLEMLYCHPQHTRLGLADALLEMAEEAALAEGLPRLYTEASELARAAFERAGYAAQHRRDFTIEGPDGEVPIHNYAMEKRLK